MSGKQTMQDAAPDDGRQGRNGVAGGMMDIRALSPAERRLSLASVMAHMVGIGLTLGLTFPLTSLTMASWGSAGWVIGVASAMSPLAILLFFPVLPKVAKRLGAIRAMVIGCAIGAAALVTMYLVQTPPAWIAIRFVIGAGLALPWLVGDVWINSVAEEKSRGRVIAAYVSCFFMGFASGPVALDLVGIDGFAPFGLCCVALALAVLPLVAVRRLAPPIEAEAHGSILEPARVVPVMAAGAFFAGVTEAGVFSLLTIWGLAVGLDETATLRLLTTCIIGGVVLQLFVGVIADRVPRQVLIGSIGLALAVASVGLQLSAGLLIFVFAFLTGGMVLGLYGMSLTLIGERFPPEKLAVASAAFLALYQVGSVAGPVIIGAGMDRAGPAGFVAVLAVSGLLVAILAFTTRRKSSMA